MRFGPPIAQVAGAAATYAALDAVTEELRRARAEGRLVQALPLASIEVGYLVRDRLAGPQEELDPLVESLRARGQQTPIEVADLGPDTAGDTPGGGRRYGLISGWRRLTALARLHRETGDPRFATVLALLRRPADAAAAYLAMVEENEIRLGLSYYERARIVAKSVEAGVFHSPKSALQGLFGAASRSRRSKIGSFLTVVMALDGVLRFPAALTERAGLALSHAIELDPGLGPRLAARLREAPPASAEAELALLQEAALDEGLGAGLPPRSDPVPEAAPEAGSESAPDSGPPARETGFAAGQSSAVGRSFAVGQSSAAGLSRPPASIPESSIPESSIPESSIPGLGMEDSPVPDSPVPDSPGPNSPGPAAAPARPVATLDRPDDAEEPVHGIYLQSGGGWLRPRFTLSGPRVDAAFRARLVAWLQDQG